MGEAVEDVWDDDRVISQLQDSRMDRMVFGHYGSWRLGFRMCGLLWDLNVRILEGDMRNVY